jgi:hypothetical protein
VSFDFADSLANTHSRIAKSRLQTHSLQMRGGFCLDLGGFAALVCTFLSFGLVLCALEWMWMEGESGTSGGDGQRGKAASFLLHSKTGWVCALLFGFGCADAIKIESSV